jgi:flagellar FliL protein
MSDAEKQNAAAAPKKKPKFVLILTVLIALLAGGGAGGYWMYSHRNTETPATEPEPPPPGVVDMDPFVVNLADEGGNRFLRVHMKLLTWDEHQATELKEDMVVAARIRSAILELLSLQYAGPLVTPEGKGELKKAIAERATETAGEELQVTDVLFVEFVVQ